jgi:CRP-like cAMP-binding protein
MSDSNAPDVVMDEADAAEWSMTTAKLLQERGDHQGAADWYRRAVAQLMESGRDEEALTVARHAASLVAVPSRTPSVHVSAMPPRVTTQPSQVPHSISGVKPSQQMLLDDDDPSESGEVSAQKAVELLAALRNAISFQPLRATEGDQLAVRLSTMKLFRDVQSETLRAVARQISVATFEAGEAIITPTHTGNEPPLFVLLEGRGLLRASGETGPGTPLGPGDYVGEISALYGGSAAVTATAREFVRAVAIPRSLVLWLARELPEVRIVLEDTAWERAFNAVGRAAPFLRRLPPDQRGIAYSRFEQTLLSPGDLLSGEGSPPLALWLIAAGEVEVYGGGLSSRQPVRARAGDLIGLRSMLEGEPSGVTARTLGTVLAAKVGVTSFRQLIEKYPKLADAMEDIGIPGRAVVC